MSRIAVDFDETFTDDPLLWGAFIQQAKARLHHVMFVTFRSDKGDNSDIFAEAEALGIEVIFTSGRQKQHVVEADIWIDDQPQTVVAFEHMVNMHDGCVVNNDMVPLPGIKI
jgi:hypothetical protein